MLPIANVVQPLVDACQWVLELWHDRLGDFPGSWVWSLILLTFTVRLCILPLAAKGVKGMQRLQQLEPEIKRIQERYKDDRQRMNQEVMAFYQREKVNPLSSCMPLILQIPFFIALFSLLRSTTFKEDIAGNPGFLFIDNLAVKATGATLAILIVLYVGTQLIASVITAISADPTQRRIMLALPFFFVIFIINFPAGLIVYWITTNVWTIGQQLLVRKLYPKPPPIEPRDDSEVAKPARGKPPPQPAAAALTDGAEQEKPKATARAAKEPAKASGGGNGSGASKAPPPNPRKKKKRSGRRR